ncbi:MAG: HAMP domain-containing sensor histidine kinase [Candidatus Promineifilaceae bacterium]|nr:HAMP domain-containing sensor histidine kinase [Candidatus Promineifilaceae bacterium]
MDSEPRSNGTTAAVVAARDSKPTGQTVTGEILRESDALYRLLVEQLPGIVYMTDSIGSRHMRYVSPQLEVQLGYRPEAWMISQRGWEAALYPADRDQVLATLVAHEAARSEAITLAYRLLSYDGQVRWYRDEARLMRRPGVEPMVQGLLVDITAHKEQETAVRQKNLELAESNQQLRKQNDELDAFSHTVAHDLKNPLTVLAGLAEVLGSHYQEGEQTLLAEASAGILESAQRMETIVDELLLLAEVRRSDEVARQTFHMGDVVDDTLRRMNHLIRAKQAKVNLPAAWPLALGHPAWVQEIWVNYISNAIKYGGTPAEVTLGAGPASNGMARFWVQDNGPGIDAADRSRLFAPFTRLSDLRVQGYGLGLSIVRRIATRMGGQVGLESSSGHGSTFWFTLPLPG